MEKRIELNCQTHYSKGASVISPGDLSEIADINGLVGIAITDADDINAWYESYIYMREDIENGFKLIYGITVFVDELELGSEQLAGCYMTILVQNEEGRRNLFELLSFGTTKYKEQASSDRTVHLCDLLEYRKGLLIGWSHENSHLSSGYDREEESWHKNRLEKLSNILDYYEVAPISYNPHYPFDDEGSPDITEWIIQCADKANKPVVAVSAAKYIDEGDAEAWKILRYNTYSPGRVYMEQNVKAHLMNTEELLKSFEYLGAEKAEEIVIENPLKIAESIDLAFPFSMDRHYLYKEDSRKELAEICFERARELYGMKLPTEVEKRIKIELSAIEESGCETLIMKMRELVRNTGVVSEPHNLWGSLDNSLVIYLCGIGTVNPLKPHYLCDKCGYSDFDTDGLKVKIGYSLPDRKCPVCGRELGRDGFNLPFEGAFGINGDKIPDFNLNVRPSRQREVQDAVSSLAGVNTSFKAMTCSTINYKRADEMIDKYQSYTSKVIDDVREAYKERLSGCFTGYGLHPGRVFLFPDGVGDISNYLPLYRQESGDIVSGVEFHQIDNLLYSMCILALNQHELLYRLEKETDYPLADISFTDYSAFEALPKCEDGTLMLGGVFNLDNEFAQYIIRIIMDAKGKLDFLDLLQINGMMHGTGVWLGNGELLFGEGHDFVGLISTREDCYDYFVQHGIEHKTAYLMMEDIGKGKAVRNNWENKWKSVLEEHDIPEWYMDSCKKIKYLFPRAHCASNVKMQWQLICYKVHYPEVFYRTYIDVYGSAADKKIISGGTEMIKATLDKMKYEDDDYGTDHEMMFYDENTKVLKIALEMYERGFSYSLD